MSFFLSNVAIMLFACDQAYPPFDPNFKKISQEHGMVVETLLRGEGKDTKN